MGEFRDRQHRALRGKFPYGGHFLDALEGRVFLSGGVGGVPSVVPIDLGVDAVDVGSARLSDNGQAVVLITDTPGIRGDRDSAEDLFFVDRVTDRIDRLRLPEVVETGEARIYNVVGSGDLSALGYSAGYTELLGRDQAFLDSAQRSTAVWPYRALPAVPEVGAYYQRIESISRDGRFVFFTSDIDGVVADDTNGQSDTFVLDQASGEIVRLSVDEIEGHVATGWGLGEVSRNGRYVVMSMRYQDVDPATEYSGPVNLLYWHDRLTGEMRRVDVAYEGQLVGERVGVQAVSDDGQTLLVWTGETYVGADQWPDAFLYDMVTGESETFGEVGELGGDGGVVFVGEGLAMSDDGRYVAYGAHHYVSQGVGVRGVYRLDRVTGESQLIAEGDWYSSVFDITPDGQYVLFEVDDQLQVADFGYQATEAGSGGYGLVGYGLLTHEGRAVYGYVPNGDAGGSGGPGGGMDRTTVEPIRLPLLDSWRTRNVVFDGRLSGEVGVASNFYGYTHDGGLVIAQLQIDIDERSGGGWDVRISVEPRGGLLEQVGSVRVDRSDTGDVVTLGTYRHRLNGVGEVTFDLTSVTFYPLGDGGHSQVSMIDQDGKFYGPLSGFEVDGQGNVRGVHVNGISRLYGEIVDLDGYSGSLFGQSMGWENEAGEMGGVDVRVEEHVNLLEPGEGGGEDGGEGGLTQASGQLVLRVDEDLGAGEIVAVASNVYRVGSIDGGVLDAVTAQAAEQWLRDDVDADWISDDGKRLVMRVGYGGSSADEVLLYDRVLARVTGLGGWVGRGHVNGAKISDDGRVVAMWLGGGGGVNEKLLVGEVDAGGEHGVGGGFGLMNVAVIAMPDGGQGYAQFPAVSDMSVDGRFVLFESHLRVAGDDGGDGGGRSGGAIFNTYQTYVFDRETGLSRRVSEDLLGQRAESWFFASQLSDDGRYALLRSSGVDRPTAEAVLGSWGGVGFYVVDLWTDQHVRLVHMQAYMRLGMPVMSGDGSDIAGLLYEIEGGLMAQVVVGNPLWDAGAGGLGEGDVTGAIEGEIVGGMGGVGGVFEDVNGDGVRQGDEPGLGGVVVFLDGNRNGVLDEGETQTVTDETGAYRFEGLGAGVYQVAEVLPDGFVRTTGLEDGLPVGVEEIEVLVDRGGRALGTVGSWYTSADGRYVSYAAWPEDGSNGRHRLGAWWTDMETGESVLIAEDAMVRGISGNGRFVVVVDGSQRDDRFMVWDRTTGGLSLLGGIEGERHDVQALEISDDGRFIVAMVEDYGREPRFRWNDTVVLIDREAHVRSGQRVRWIDPDGEAMAQAFLGVGLSELPANFQGDVSVRNLLLARDGSLVVLSLSGYSTPGYESLQATFVYDVATGEMVGALEDRYVTAVDATGTRLGVLVERLDEAGEHNGGGGSGGAWNVGVYDRTTGQTRVIDTYGVGDVGIERFDESGRYVFITTRYRGLAAGDSDDADDIYRYDLRTDTMQLASAEPADALHFEDARLVGVSADGTQIIYSQETSHATGEYRYVRVTLGVLDDAGMRVAVVSGDEAVAGPVVGLTAVGSQIEGQFDLWGLEGVDYAEAWADAVVYLDANGNGVRDDGEAVAVTRGRGEYEFTNVQRGSYTLGVEWPEALAMMLPQYDWLIEVDAGERVSHSPRYAAASEITGLLFADVNQNGVQDASESGLAGVEVYLDINRNGGMDEGERRVLTDEQGRYTFDRVLFGDYVVGVAGISASAGQVVTTRVPVGEQVLSTLAIDAPIEMDEYGYPLGPSNAMLSGDGQWVVYNGNGQVYVHDVAGGQARALAMLGESDRAVTMSDDGLFILVQTIAGQDEMGRLVLHWYVYDRLADTYALLDMPSPEVPAFSGYYSSSYSEWHISDGGRYVSYVWSQYWQSEDLIQLSESRSDVYVMDRQGGKIVPIVIPGTEDGTIEDVSADGRFMVLTVRDQEGQEGLGGMYRYDVANGQAVRIGGGEYQ